MGVDFRYPKRRAIPPLPPPREFAIASAHQGQPALHQADRSLTQIVGLDLAVFNRTDAKHRSFVGNATIYKTTQDELAERAGLSARYVGGHRARRRNSKRHSARTDCGHIGN